MLLRLLIRVSSCVDIPFRRPRGFASYSMYSVQLRRSSMAGVTGFRSYFILARAFREGCGSRQRPYRPDCCSKWSAQFELFWLGLFRFLCVTTIPAILLSVCTPFKFRVCWFSKTFSWEFSQSFIIGHDGGTAQKKKDFMSGTERYTQMLDNAPVVNGKKVRFNSDCNSSSVWTRKKYSTRVKRSLSPWRPRLNWAGMLCGTGSKNVSGKRSELKGRRSVTVKSKKWLWQGCSSAH